MFGFFGCAEGAVIFAIVLSSGLNMDTGINFLLRGLAGVMVAVIATAASTTTTPPARTTSPEGRHASAGCSGVFKGGCGTLESRIKFLQLVESCEVARVSMDL